MIIRYYSNPLSDIYREVSPVDNGGSILEAIPREYLGENFIYYVYGFGKVPFDSLSTIRVDEVVDITICKKIAGGGKLGGANIRTSNAITTFGWSEAIRYVGRVTGVNAALKWMFSPSAAIGSGYNSASTDNNKSDNSTTYSWDGVQTLASAGIPIPIVYGKCLLGGNLINVYTRTRGNDQVVYALLALCEGPVHSIAGIYANTDDADLETIGDKIRIEDTPVNEIPGVKVGIRLGQETQNPFPNFTVLREQIEFPSPISLLFDDPQTFTLANSDVTELTILFEHQGLAGVDDSGQLVDFTYRARIEHRLAGRDDPWKLLGFYEKTAASTSKVNGEFLVENVFAVVVDVYTAYTSSNDSTVPTAEVWFSPVDLTGVGPGDKFIISIRAERDANLGSGRGLVVELGSAGQNNQELQWNFFPASTVLPSNGNWAYDLQLDFGDAVPQGVTPIDLANVRRIRIYLTSGSRTRVHFMSARVRKSSSWEEGRAQQIRVTQLSANSDNLHRITTTKITARIEGRDLALSYPRTALLALEIPAGEKVSGSVTNIKTVCEGREILVVDEVGQSPYRAYSNNPIFCIADMLLDKNYGIGLFYATPFNWDQLLEEALILQPASGPPKYEMNAVIDYEAPALSVINELAGNFRINVYYDGVGIVMKVRRDKPVSYVINMSNIKALSFAQSSSELSSTPNYFVVEYLNEANFWEKDYFVLEDEDLTYRGGGIVKYRVQSRGMTNEEQIAKFINYLRKVMKKVVQTIKFTGFADAQKINVGDVFLFQHDVAQYGLLGGRIAANCGANTISFDKELRVEANAILSLATKNYLDEVQFNTIEVPLHPVDPITGLCHYPPGFVFETTNFLLNPPREFDLYSVGIRDEGETDPKGKSGKVYYCESVNFTENGEVEIIATEHFPELYDDSMASFDPIPQSVLPNPTLPPKPVANLTASSEPSYYPIVRISFTVPNVDVTSGFHQKAVVFWSDNDGQSYNWGGESRGNTVLLYGLAPAKTYKFQVVSVSTLGKFSLTRPEITYTPQPGIPAKVSGLRLKNSANSIFNTRDAEFVWNPVSTLSSIVEADSESNGAGSGNRPEYIEGYRVVIKNPYAGVLSPPRREDFVVDEHYNYQFAMNQQDLTDYISNALVFGGPLRDVVIQVSAVDRFNQEGPISVIQVRNNNPKIPAFSKTPDYFNDSRLFNTIDWGDSFQLAYEMSSLDTSWFSYDETTFQFVMTYEQSLSSDNDEDFVGYAIYFIPREKTVGDMYAEFLGVFNPGTISAVLRRMADGRTRIVIIKPLDVFDVNPFSQKVSPTKLNPYVGIPNCTIVRMDR